MSGYEKSEEYGGREPGPYSWLKVALLAAAIALVVWGVTKYAAWDERTGGILGAIRTACQDGDRE